MKKRWLICPVEKDPVGLTKYFMRRGTYCGVRRRLQGKAAMLRPLPGGTYYAAKFEDQDVPEGFFWSPFKRSDFKTVM